MVEKQLKTLFTWASEHLVWTNIHESCEIQLYKDVETTVKSIKNLYEHLGGKVLSM